MDALVASPVPPPKVLEDSVVVEASDLSMYCSSGHCHGAGSNCHILGSWVISCFFAVIQRRCNPRVLFAATLGRARGGPVCGCLGDAKEAIWEVVVWRVEMELLGDVALDRKIWAGGGLLCGGF